MRRAEVADVELLLSLVREFYVLDRHEFDEEHVRRGLGPLLVDDTVGQVWLVDDGYAVVTWGWSLESGGREALLDEIYVRVRGDGLGGVLLDHALRAAAAAGASRMFLETEAHNVRAREFYRRHGFVVEDSVWLSCRL